VPLKTRPLALVLVGLIVLIALAGPLAPAEAQQATRSGALSFENADIRTVIKAIGVLAGITFLYDPEQVKGRITLLSPKSVSPAAALELLKSALALHGYSLLSRAEGMWIVPAVWVRREAMAVKVVPLTYAKAGELADTLSWIAPPWVRVVPYYPTNSLIISGPPAAVEELIDIIKPSAHD
jgi:type II secretory pathway component GspD/PulD (secretin)